MMRTASTKQVADALGVTPSTVQLYSRERRIPFDITPGGHRRYDIAEVKTSLTEPSDGALTPLGGPGIGTGTPVERSPMAALDAARRAVVGERMTSTEIDGEPAESAAVELIGHSRRILVSL